MKKPRRAHSDAATHTRSVESFRLPAALIASVALIVRAVHVWQIRRAPFFEALMGDARGYDEWALRLSAGNWLGGDVFYQAPLYPYFLGAIYATLGRDLFVVRLLQAVLGAAACVLLGAAANRLFSKRAGLVAGLALALYAPAIFFDALVQKAVLDVFFICLMLWIASGLMTRESRPAIPWLWLGLATGCLALTRENALVFVLVLLAWAFLSPAGTAGHTPTLAQRVKTPAVFAAGLALVLLPVALRNYAVGGGFYLTTSQLGPNFFIGNNPKADGAYHALKPGRGAPEFERQDATELAEQALGRRLSPAEVSSYWTERALAFVVNEPVAWLRLVGRKFVLLTNRTEMMDTEAQDTYAEWSWPLRLGGWIGHFGVLVPLAALGAWIAWPMRRRIWPLYAMVAAYGLSLLAFFVFARYRYPLVPLLLMFAAPGVVAIPAFIRQSTALQRAAVTVMLAVALVLSNWPIAEAGMPQALTEYNLGLTLNGLGRHDEAANHFRRATTFSATFAPPWVGLGLVAQAQAKPDEAIAMFRRAIQVGPAYPDAYYHLGTALQTRGEHGEALSLLRQYVDMAPDAASAASARNLAGFSLVDLGRLEEAQVLFQESAASQPGNAEARRGIGEVLLKQRRFPEAAREFQDAVRRAPENALALHSLGLSLAMQGRDAEAVEPFRKAADLQPANAAFRQDLGTALAASGRLDEAITAYTRARALDPDNASIEFTLGTALLAQGRASEAVPHLQRAVQLDPQNVRLREEVQAAMRALGK